MTIGFEIISYEMKEGTTVEVCAIIVSGELDREAVITLSSSDGTAQGVLVD